MTEHYLITGGAGFIGSHLARRLVSEKHKVTVVDNLSNGFVNNLPATVEFIHADLTRQDSCTTLPDYPYRAVFHLAAQTSGALSFDNPVQDMKSHVLATLNLMNWCCERHIRRVLYSSSTTTYGEPISLPIDERHAQRPRTYYAAGKMACEAYLSFFGTRGLHTTIFRLPNVYGPGQNLENRDQGMVSIYLSYMLENQPIIVKGSTERFRDFIFVEDTVDAFIMGLSNKRTHGNTYNIATGEKTTVRQILDGLMKAFGIEDYPVEVHEGTPGDQFGVTFDATSARRDFGWTYKVSIDRGLKATVEHAKRRSENE